MNNTQPFSCCGMQVIVTRRFQRTWKRLSTRVQRIVQKKVILLLNNPYHPSLQAHRHHRAGQHIWECYISVSLRLLYQYDGDILRLYEVGSHAVVERAHLRQF